VLSASRGGDGPAGTGDAGAVARSAQAPVADGVVHVATVTGMGAVLARADDGDWIVVQRGSDTPDVPEAVPPVPDIATWLLRRGAPVGAVGRRGMQFDRRSGRLVPLGEQELSGPVTVDAIDVDDDFMIVRVAAARAVGGFDEDLARGFDAVDYCLRLQRAGYGIYVDGPAAPRSRYDDVQSRIVLLRRYASTRRALAVSAALVTRAPTAVLAAWRPPKRP